MKWKLTSDQMLVSGISLLLLSIAFIIILAVSQSRQVKETNNQVTHSQDIISGTEKLYALVFKNESSTKKYAVTGDKNLIGVIERNRKEIVDQLNRLKSLTSKMPVQNARVDSLTKIINKRIAFSNRVLSVRDAKGTEAAQAMMRTPEGTSFSEKIRLVANEIILAEYYNVKPLEGKDEKMLARHIIHFHRGDCWDPAIIDLFHPAGTDGIIQKKKNGGCLRAAKQGNGTAGIRTDGRAGQIKKYIIGDI